MKRIINIINAIALVFALAVSLTACAPADPWKSAKYTEDTTLGEGTCTFYTEVKVGEHTVTFTIKTDETILGDALLGVELIAGEDSDYGLYVKDVNGIRADYDLDQAYWGFYENGEMLMVGVDGVEIEDGDHYEIVYSK